MLSEHFVCTFEQVGKFTSLEQRTGFRGRKTSTRPLKVGGNVVSYFCTPQSEVLFFLVGPVSPETLREKAAWVAKTYREIQGETKADSASRRARMREFHLQQVHEASRTSFEKEYKSHWVDAESFYARDDAVEALINSALESRAALFDEYRHASRSSQKELLVQLRKTTYDAAHLVLAEMPLAKLSQLEKVVFERRAGQRFARRNQRNDALLRAMSGYRQERRPTLLVLSGGVHSRHARQRLSSQQRSIPIPPKKSAFLLSQEPVKTLAAQFGRVELNLLELTTLLDDLDEKPVKVTPREEVRFVIYHASGQHVSTLGEKAGQPHLVQALKRALAVSHVANAELEEFLQITTIEERLEKQAAGQLRLAEMFVDIKPDVARQRLEMIVKEYSGTEAAAKAKEILAKRT